MKKFVFFYFLFSSFLFANGGGYHLGNAFTGGIAPFTAEGTEHIEILHEQLDIHLGEEEAKVKVVYKMKNTSAKKQDVKFGFPVEDVKNPWGGPKKKKTKSEYCKNYKVSLNGKELKATYFAEPFSQGKIKPFPGSEVLVGIEGWNVSEMVVQAGEEINLMITFDSVYDYPSSFVSDDTVDGPWKFKYRFSSGAIWKNSIKKGQVVIHLNAIDASGVKIIKPVNKYKLSEGKLSWEFSDFEPTLKDDLEIRVKPTVSEYSAHYPNEGIISYFNINDKWYANHVKYNVTASSTLPQQGENKYPAENLKNLGGVVWSEGTKGSGINESLTFEFSEPTKIAFINLITGYVNYYQGKEYLFEANNRLKSCEILINGKEKQNIQFKDIKDAQRIAINSVEQIKTLKLTIKGVYKGQKFDDTCISFVGFLTPLSKEPKTYGAR